MKNNKIEEIKKDGEIIAIIIYIGYKKEGITFFTPNEFSQQLAYMNHPSGKVIQAHIHNSVSRQVHFTQEVLFIKSGKVKIDFYSKNKEFFTSRVLSSGDIILLALGGHGFEMLEKTEIIEVKQGPYTGDQDKTRF